MSFENENGRTSHSIYYLPKVQIKDYNVKIDDISFFDQPVNKNIKTYGNAIKIATGQGDNYTTGCLLDYPYLKEDCKMIAIALGKQQALDADPTAMRQINFTASLDRAWNIQRYNDIFHCWKSKRNCFEHFTRNCKSIAKSVIE